MTDQTGVETAEAKDLYEKALHFPDGLPGLPDLEHFVMIHLVQVLIAQILQPFHLEVLTL